MGTTLLERTRDGHADEGASPTVALAGFTERMQSSDPPGEVAAFVADRILDTVGVMVGARPMPHVTGTLRTIEALSSGGPCTVVAAGRKAPALDAMLANGAMAHGIDFDDTHAFIHPGAAVVTAALALAEADDRSGADLIRAATAGYEVAVRASLAGGLTHRSRGFHPTGTCNVFGAAAAAAVLLGLTADQIVSAFGIAGSAASGIVQYRVDGAATKHLHAGFAARNGALSAMLAGNDVAGPADIFEGRFGFLAIMADLENVHKLSDGLGTRYDLLKTETKLYPMCRQTNSSLDLAHELVEQHGVRAPDVQSIKVFVTDYVMKGDWFTRNDPPPNTLKARINFPYGIAATIVNGRLLEPHFAEAEIRRAETLELMTRITVLEGEEQTRRWPPERGAAIECTLKDGRTVTLVSRNPKGSDSKPLTLGDLKGKFDGLVEPVFGPARTRELFDALSGLRDLKSVRTLTRILA